MHQPSLRSILFDVSAEDVDWFAFCSYLCTESGHESASRQIKTPSGPLGWLLSRNPPPHVVRSVLDSHHEEIFAPENLGMARMTPLHQACFYGASVEVVRIILAKDPSAASQRNRTGSPPLFFAGDADTARLLLAAHPASVAVSNMQGWLPLHACAHEQDRSAALAWILIEGGRRQGLGGGANGGGGALVTNLSADTPLTLVCSAVASHSRSVPPSPLRDEHLEEWSKLVVIARAAHEAATAACGKGDGSANDVEPSKHGFYVLHGVLDLQCHPSVIWHALHRHPEQASQRDECRRLPLHIAAAAEPAPKQKLVTVDGASKALGEFASAIIKWVLDANPEAAGCADSTGRLALHLAAKGGRDWEQGMEDLVWAEPRALKTPDVNTGLYPFALAASGGCSVGTVYMLLLEDPSILTRFCTEKEEKEKVKEPWAARCQATCCHGSLHS